LDETDEAPRMTQLPRVEPKSAFHFWSAIVGAELAHGQLDVEAPQLERSSSEDEWWETSATGAGSGSERRDTATAAGRIWPSAWMGLVAMPPTRTRAMCLNAPCPRLAPGAAGSLVRWRRRAAGRRDDAVNVDEDGVDEWHERVEATQDEGVAAECLDVADAVEDIEQHRVVEPLELIHGLGLAASIPSKLQAHRSGSRRCVGAGQGESRDGKDVRKHNQRRCGAWKRWCHRNRSCSRRASTRTACTSARA
jgi:hypothetical protein